MPHLIAKLLVGALLIYAGLCVVLFFFQRSLLYAPIPRPPDDKTPTQTLAVEGANLVINLRNQEDKKAAIYFGGNGENVSFSLPALAAGLPDRAIFQMNYRGYGGSTGTPSESVLFADALRLFDLVHEKHADIALIGRSLGSGVAVYVASRRTVSHLVLVTPYNSIEEIAAGQFPYFPVSWLLRDKFESWKYAEKVSAQTLIIAAEQDEVIPRASTESLFAHFPPGAAKLQTVLGVGHNSISNSAGYISLLRVVQ